MDRRHPLPLLFAALAAAAVIVRQRRARQAVERFAGATLQTLLNAIEANDPRTGMHVRRVARYALIIADAAGLDERQQQAVERVALFHDIGKIYEALFDIVHEASRLSINERRAVATHPQRGAEVLAPLAAFYPELPIGVLAHHERWDGSGYPRHLRGARIPIEARIVAIADTLDSVARSRRYRRGRGIEAAMTVIAEGRATQFDPDLVDLALFPAVAERLMHAHITQRNTRGGRRDEARDRVPDVKFRWRSESLGSGGIHAARQRD